VKICGDFFFNSFTCGLARSSEYSEPHRRTMVNVSGIGAVWWTFEQQTKPSSSLRVQPCKWKQPKVPVLKTAVFSYGRNQWESNSFGNTSEDLSGNYTPLSLIVWP